MPQTPPHSLLREEVSELTGLLRNSADWLDLRMAVHSMGLDHKDVFLCSFYEDDEEREYGLILTGDRQFIEYVRITTFGAAPGFSEWRTRTPDDDLRANYLTIDAALELFAEGHPDQP